MQNQIQNEPKFEIGDKVRVIVYTEDNLWSSCHDKGAEGKIVRIQFPNKNQEHIAYDVLVGTLGQWHPDYELELVEGYA